jgi:hypothetical protein
MKTNGKQYTLDHTKETVREAIGVSKEEFKAQLMKTCDHYVEAPTKSEVYERILNDPEIHPAAALHGMFIAGQTTKVIESSFG